MVTNASPTFVSFSFNLFPIYSSLKVKTNPHMAKCVGVSVSLTGLIYSTLAISAVFLFGNTIEKAGANVLININAENEADPNVNYPESYVLRVLFMIVLACHIPFLFFSGKEACLIIIDEIDRRSISKSLEERIFALNL